MRIGILGSGSVARSLAGGFINQGHDIMMGTRDSNKLRDWSNSIDNKVNIGSFEQAAKYGEIIILAVKGTAAESALNLATGSALSGKIIIDATNPISEVPPQNGVLQFFTDINKSLMETLQEKFPESHFVKAFSSVGAGLMVNPGFGNIKPTMFIAGNSAKAKEEVRKILDSFGWEAEDMGGAEAARAIEPLCILWCIPGFSRNEWSHAFKLLKK